MIIILVNCVDLACQQPVSLVNLLNHIDNDHETEVNMLVWLIFSII